MAKCVRCVLTLLVLLPAIAIAARPQPETQVPASKKPASRGPASDGPATKGPTGKGPSAKGPSPKAPTPKTKPPSSGRGIIVTGELDVLAVHNQQQPAFFLRSADGDHIPLALDESFTRLAGYGLRLQLSFPSSSNSSSPSPSASPSSNSSLAGSPSAAGPSPYRELLPGPLPRRSLLANTPAGSGSTPENSLLGSPAAEVEDLQIVTVPPPAEKDIGAGPVTIRSVVFLFKFCGFGPSLTVDAFKAMWFKDETRPSAVAMDSYFASCSQGMATMTQESQTVVEVPIPCKGQVGARLYDLRSKCTDNELYGMMSLADEYVTNTLGIDISAVKQRIGVLPQELAGLCRWAGLASVGCSGSRCFAWINGRSASNLAVYFHEIGHNLGLLHSSRAGVVDEYGDTTCNMGSSTGCYNAANTWRLGWTTPLPGGELNTSNFRPGQWLSYSLPYAGRTRANHLRIVPNWAAANPVDIWSRDTRAAWPGFTVSLRVREGYDTLASGLAPKPGRVVVHSSNHTLSPVSFQRTRLETLLGVGGIYRSPQQYGFAVRVDSIALAVGAQVSVCRADQVVERGDTCGDGLDNDCDGLTDGEDPDCGGSGSVSSPSPSRRQPRRAPRLL